MRQALLLYTAYILGLMAGVLAHIPGNLTLIPVIIMTVWLVRVVLTSNSKKMPTNEDSVPRQ